MRAKLLVSLSVIAIVAAGCTGSVDQTDRPNEPLSIPTETLLLGTGAGAVVVSVPNGSVLFERPGSLSSLGGGWVISTSASGGSTTLETRTGVTGEVVATTDLSGELEARLISESGRSVALMEPLPEGWDPRVPIPRSRTTIVVADPSDERELRTFDLRGNFEPEAFSTDDNRLFMIQHLPAETPTVYRVTVLDLRRGRVLPVFGPFKGPAERMPGIRLQQMLSPAGDQLYTLYSSARPGYVPHGAPGPAGAVVSFVHVLSLQEGWAHCVGLPRVFWDRPAAEQALATSPNGRLLYVVNSALGVVSVMDTQTLGILRTARVGRTVDGAARTSAVVSEDGASLFVGAANAVMRIDTDTFDVADVWRTGSISGLGLSADGKRLYVATGDRIGVLDVATGDELGTMVVPSPAPIDRLSALAS